MTHWDKLEELDESGTGLTRWEVRFVSDILDNPSMDDDALSAAQKAKIQQLYEERVT